MISLRLFYAFGFISGKSLGTPFGLLSALGIPLDTPPGILLDTPLDTPPRFLWKEYPLGTPPDLSYRDSLQSSPGDPIRAFLETPPDPSLGVSSRALLGTPPELSWRRHFGLHYGQNFGFDFGLHFRSLKCMDLVAG